MEIRDDQECDAEAISNGTLLKLRRNDRCHDASQNHCDKKC